MVEDKEMWEEMGKNRIIVEEKQSTRKFLREPNVHFRRYSIQSCCLAVIPSRFRYTDID